MEDISIFMSDTYVFHIDANSAFLSWSAVYRSEILGEPVDLRDIASIVGGDQEKRQGIVLAKSIPAKKYGIVTGEPLVTAFQKCPHLVSVPPDYKLYIKASKALMSMLSEYTDCIVPYSIDEAWAVFKGYNSLYGKDQMVSFAYMLKDRIHKELGFTVNIGISTNFLLAKMAGDFSKPDKVHTLFLDEIPKKMWPLPVSDLFFVGKATTLKLHRLGIKTIGDLASADPKLVYSHLKSCGSMIQEFAKGQDLKPFLFMRDANKGYGNSLTAPMDVSNITDADEILLSLSETVATRLRMDHVYAGEVSVHITTCDFEHKCMQEKLISSTNVTSEICEVAGKLLRRLWNQQIPIRQIGVHTSRLQSDEIYQYNLFTNNQHDRLKKLDVTIDKIRSRYGEDAIKRACFLKSQIPHMGGGLDSAKRSGMIS